MAMSKLIPYCILKDSSDWWVAKVADFGYSTNSIGHNEIFISRSGHWTAPEWRHRALTFSSAKKKMDVCSFAVLCLGLLLYRDCNHQRHGFPQYIDSRSRSSSHFSDIVLESTDISEQQRKIFVKFFTTTVALDPEDRTAD